MKITRSARRRASHSVQGSLIAAALLELPARATWAGVVPAGLAALADEGAAAVRRIVGATLEEEAVHAHHARGGADEELLAFLRVD